MVMFLKMKGWFLMSKSIIYSICKFIKSTFTGICIATFSFSLIVLIIDTFNLYDLTHNNNLISIGNLQFDYITALGVISFCCIPICIISIVASAIKLIFKYIKAKEICNTRDIILFFLLLVINLISTFLILSCYLIKFGV